MSVGIKLLDEKFGEREEDLVHVDVRFCAGGDVGNALLLGEPLKEIRKERLRGSWSIQLPMDRGYLLSRRLRRLDHTCFLQEKIGKRLRGSRRRNGRGRNEKEKENVNTKKVLK